VEDVMNVSGVSSTTGTTETERGPRQPSEVTKSGLEEMRDRIEKSGGQVPDGLDTLIEKFDAAAGSSGKMTFDEFKSFAKENGVTIQDPPKGSAPQGGRPPAGGRAGATGGGAAPRGSSETSSSSTSSSTSSDDVTSLTDAQLQALVAKGDTKATRELERREAARKTPDDPVGQNMDKYV
jgi:hypothetical protein